MADSFSKQTAFQGARFLNDVNDAVIGGQINAVPTGTQATQAQQTLPGDRLVLDDATALALSDTAVGTLFGGVYMYVGVISTATAVPAVGTLCFYTLASIGTTYVFTSDANPTTALPAYLAGIFINALTRGNFGWIQIMGVATVLFDSAITAASNTVSVSAKVSAVVASTSDAGVALTTITLSFVYGYAIGTPVVSTLSKVGITRPLVRW